MTNILRLVFKVALLVTITFSAYPLYGLAAHDPGLLRGVADTSGVTTMTDGDPMSGMNPATGSTRTFLLPSSSMVGSYYFDAASASPTITMKLYDSAGSVVYSAALTGVAQETIIMIDPVEVTRMEVTNTGSYGGLQEIELYEADTTPPGTPTIIGVTEGVGENTLEWTESLEPDFAHYNVYRDGAFLDLTFTNSFTDLSASPGTTYSYQVSSSDTAGNESALSSEVVATSLYPDTTPPTIPYNVRTTVTDTVYLSWEDGGESDLDHFNIYRDGTLLDSTTTNHYHDTSVLIDTTYRYELTSVDTEGNESEMSSAVNVTPREPYRGTLFDPGEVDYGLSVVDLFLTVVDIVMSVDVYVLLGLALTVTPVVIAIIKRAVN